MIENLVIFIQSIIFEYGAWGVFVATLIEEIIAPIPSPIISLAAGFFLLPVDLSVIEILLRALVMIAFPVALGISIGSALVYALGFWGGKPVIEKTKKVTGIDWADIQRSEERLTRGSGDEITLFVLRILPIVPGVAISGFCGIVRYPFQKFMTITFVGAFVRAFVLGLVGWQVGALYTTYAGWISRFEKYILVGVLIVVVVAVGAYYINKKNKKHRG